MSGAGTAVINLGAFVALVCFLSLRWRERITDVLPTAACILILLLYVLAFPGRLAAVDWLAAAGLLLVGICFLKMGAEKRRELCRRLWKELTHPGCLAMVLLLAGTAFLVRGRVVIWWDDLNFWAADVKGLYALGGFAAKYTNVAPEFGDYPPATSLVKWWFAHFSPGGFSEGLMFAGYYFCLFVFFAPLLTRLSGRNPLTLLLAAAGLWALPGVAESFYTHGMCADLVMAAIYGAFLAAVTDREGHEPFFYYLRLALYLSVLVLTKSVGFLWAAFGLVFFVLYRRIGGKEGESGLGAGLWPVALVAGAPLLTGGSWMVFCLLMRRVARLTGAAFSMAAGHLPILLPETRAGLLASFGEAFLCWPLHGTGKWEIGFTPFALFVFLCVLIFLFWRAGLLRKEEAGLLACFLPACGLLFYGINLVSHLTIFAVETQYLEPSAMLSSIERYGAPFTVGFLYLFAFLLTRRWREKEGKSGGLRERLHENGAYLICLCFVFLATNRAGIYDGLYGYRQRLAQDLAARREMISPRSEAFLEQATSWQAGRGMRVLYLKDVAENRWTENTYVAYEASPVSLVFGNVDGEAMNGTDIRNALEASHAGYLYLDEIQGDMEALFGEMAEAVKPRTLYRIRREDGGLRLEELQNGSGEG